MVGSEAVEPTDPAQPGVQRVFQTREQRRAFYDKISRVYDLLADHSEAPMRERGLELLAARRGESVAEVGCGTGHCLAALARAVGAAGLALGVDLSPGMLAQASDWLEREGLAGRAALACADGAGLPLADEGLDALFASFTLELFDTPEIPLVLSEWARVLRPGGRIVVVGMSRAGGPEPMLRLYEWTHRHFPNFVDCRPIFVQRALEDAGFATLGSELLHMWVPVEIVLAHKARP